MSVPHILFLYSVLVVLASLAGGWLPSLVKLTHARMQLTLSCVGGLMLGVGLLHLVPHSAAETGSLDVTLAWAMGGLLATFFLIRIFHFHEHATAEQRPEHHDHAGHEHDHTEHDHSAHRHEHIHAAVHHVSLVGVGFGLALHTLIDGVAVGAAVLAEPASMLPGVGVFSAVLLHKPLDALSITSLMAASGWSARARLLVNLAFALMCPLGVVLVHVGVAQFAGTRHMLTGCALGFAGGAFLCISLSDLLPEVQFHRHDPLRLSVALLVGVGLAYAIGCFEPQHVHSPGERGYNRQDGGHDHAEPRHDHDDK